MATTRVCREKEALPYYRSAIRKTLTVQTRPSVRSKKWKSDTDAARYTQIVNATIGATEYIKLAPGWRSKESAVVMNGVWYRSMCDATWHYTKEKMDGDVSNRTFNLANAYRLVEQLDDGTLPPGRGSLVLEDRCRLVDLKEVVYFVEAWFARIPNAPIEKPDWIDAFDAADADAVEADPM